MYLRIMEKIRITDDEQRETGFSLVGQQYTWKPMPEDYGRRDVPLEAEEAKALTAAIELASPLRVADAVWLEKLVVNTALAAL